MKNDGLGNIEKRLTRGSENNDNGASHSMVVSLAANDPRLLALARFLARRAADEDFAQSLIDHASTQVQARTKEGFDD